MKRLAATIALLAFVALLVLPNMDRGVGALARGAAAEVIGFGQRGVTAVFSSIAGLWDEYVALRNVRRKNRELEEELRRYRRDLVKYGEAAALNERLRKLLDLKEETGAPSLAARIIGKDPSSWFRTVTVDRGSRDGVHPGMPVVTVEGVVGRVMETSTRVSTVILCIDPNNAVDGLVQHCRAQGIIKGDGDRYVFNYAMKNRDIRKGDLIVTSGMSGVFPKGIPIGRVVSVVNTTRGMFQDVRVRPTVDFDNLEFVTIILRDNPLTTDRGKRG